MLCWLSFLIGVRKMTWTLCDNSTMQHAQKLSETTYRIIEICLYDLYNGEYIVYSDTVSLDDYFNQDGTSDKNLFSILQSFGYGGAAHVRNIHGPEANQIMCECIFESLIPQLPGTILFKGSAMECTDYITAYCELKK